MVPIAFVVTIIITTNIFFISPVSIHSKSYMYIKPYILSAVLLYRRQKSCTWISLSYPGTKYHQSTYSLMFQICNNTNLFVLLCVLNISHEQTNSTTVELEWHDAHVCCHTRYTSITLSKTNVSTALGYNIQIWECKKHDLNMMYNKKWTYGHVQYSKFSNRFKKGLLHV